MKSNKTTKEKEISEAILKSVNFDNSYSEPYIATAKINEFKRPNKCPDILKKLDLIVKGEPTYNINKYLGEKNSQEIEFYNALLKVIPSKDSMNPHIKPYPSEKFFIHKYNGKTLSHLEKLDDLLKKDEKGQIKITKCDDGILHIGEKGSGKTFSQNIWLHKNNEEFEKNNIFWVRLDFAKLIDIWKETEAIKYNDYLSTEDYFMGQISYVFAKHFIKKFPMYSPFIGKVTDKLNENVFYNDFETLDYKLYKKDLSNSSDIEFVLNYFKKRGITKITEALHRFEKNISIYEGFYKGNERKDAKERRKGKKGYLVDKVFLDSYKKGNSDRKGTKKIWTFIGQQLREFILENNYYIFYIIDGIDNINFHHADRDNFINEAYTQILNFPLKDERIFKNEIVLLSLRDTSLEDLVNKINQEEYTDRKKFRDLEMFYKIYQDSNGIPKQALNNRIEIVIRQLKENKSIMKRVMEVMLEYNNVIDENRWYSNIRTFMHNHLNLARFITYRYYFAGEPKEFNIKRQIDHFENINFLLNGNLYIDEKVKTPKSNSGYNFFNLFGYYDDNHPKYFIYTRILQIILNERNISKKELYSQLDLFNYTKNAIDFCLDRMNRRGMIMINYTKYAKYNSIFYKITQKGKFALEIFYSDIHFLYHSSIDTLLPINLIKSFKYSPNNFSNDFNKTFYPPYSIITGLSFLNHLINCNNYHLEFIKKTKDINVSPFKLPINHSLLIDSISKMVESILNNNDKDYIDEINKHYSINVW